MPATHDHLSVPNNKNWQKHNNQANNTEIEYFDLDEQVYDEESKNHHEKGAQGSSEHREGLAHETGQDG